MSGDWKKLLDYWQNSMGRHALSFSFIVGAIKEYSVSKLGSNDSLEDVLLKLVDEIRSHQAVDYYHHIYRCPDIEVLVITKVNGNFPPPNAIPIEGDKSVATPSLYVSDGIENKLNPPIKELVKSIIREYGLAIEQGNYSRNGKNFSKFSEYDRKAIRKALA